MAGYRASRTIWVGAIALLVALVLTACGGDDGDTAPPTTNSVGSGSGDAADGSVSGASSGDDPVKDTDFPIPAPDGLVLDALVDAGLDIPSQRQLFYANDDFDRIAAFFDEWTSQNGEWARGESEGTVVFQRTDGEAVQMITVSPDHDPGAQADGPVTFVLLVAG